MAERHSKSAYSAVLARRSSSLIRLGAGLPHASVTILLYLCGFERCEVSRPQGATQPPLDCGEDAHSSLAALGLIQGVPITLATAPAYFPNVSLAYWRNAVVDYRAALAVVQSARLTSCGYDSRMLLRLSVKYECR
jgi:hypothetical protein